jgi:hypothetical protein
VYAVLPEKEKPVIPATGASDVGRLRGLARRQA